MCNLSWTPYTNLEKDRKIDYKRSFFNLVFEKIRKEVFRRVKRSKQSQRAMVSFRHKRHYVVNQPQKLNVITSLVSLRLHFCPCPEKQF